MAEANNEQKRQTVLCVDDTPEIISLIVSILGELYRVKAATSGKAALKIALSHDPPDLILLDIMMPEMDGFEVCRYLKSEPQTADIPVIFLTAKTDIEDEIKGFELGAVDYITKPISPSILLARARTHLKLRKMQEYLKSKLEREDLW